MVAAIMTNSSSTIATERKGHRRGLVLGFTMAETFLLLVFCLLLVAAAAISTERQAKNRAIRDRKSAVADLKTAQNMAQKLVVENKLLSEKDDKLERAIADVPKVDEDWRELRLARDAVNKLSEQGLSTQDVLKLAPAMKLLKERGFLADDPARIADHLDEVFRSAGLAKGPKLHNWPPIINLSEAGGYFFRTGSAELSPEFERKLQGTIGGLIAAFLAEYGVDVIEVIGHTDEQPLAGLPSNLDKSVGAILADEMPVTALKLSDNAGLGLARAIAVAKVLRADPKLAGATVLPLSGAQLIMPGDTLSDGKHPGDVEARRRIEIRIRRRSPLSTSDVPTVEH